MEIIEKYFTNLTEDQRNKFGQLGELYADWNSKINVVSRKDIENIYERHILHSLAIAKFINFQPNTSIMDLGTGGGFPTIPLAILYPNCNFHAIDGTRKKIHVVKEISEALELKNLQAEQLRAEENKRKYDFVITRAVASLDKLIEWSEPLIGDTQKNAIPNGLIALKGGNIRSEMKGIKKYIETEPISDYFEEEFFETKTIVYVQLS